MSRRLASYTNSPLSPSSQRATRSTPRSTPRSTHPQSSTRKGTSFLARLHSKSIAMCEKDAACVFGRALEMRLAYLKTTPATPHAKLVHMRTELEARRGRLRNKEGRDFDFEEGGYGGYAPTVYTVYTPQDVLAELREYHWHYQHTFANIDHAVSRLGAIEDFRGRYGLMASMLELISGDYGYLESEPDYRPRLRTMLAGVQDYRTLCMLGQARGDDKLTRALRSCVEDALAALKRTCDDDSTRPFEGKASGPVKKAFSQHFLF